MKRKTYRAIIDNDGHITTMIVGGLSKKSVTKGLDLGATYCCATKSRSANSKDDVKESNQSLLSKGRFLPLERFQDRKISRDISQASRKIVSRTTKQWDAFAESGICYSMDRALAQFNGWG